jgi:hypothetical protein
MPSTQLIEAWKDPDVIDDMARPHYRDDLEYHHYPHSLLIADIALKKADIAIAHGVIIERAVLKPASGWHDAGKHLKPVIDHPFATSEEYAVHISGPELRRAGMPERLISLTGDVIKSSSPNQHCTTDTERCFVQADLTAGGIDKKDKAIAFLNVTYLLYREAKKLKEELPIQPWDHDKLMKELVPFGDLSREILMAFLEEDLSTCDEDSDFNREAAKKVDLLRPARFTRILQAYLDDIVNYQPADRRVIGQVAA